MNNNALKYDMGTLIDNMLEINQNTNRYDIWKYTSYLVNTHAWDRKQVLILPERNIFMIYRANIQIKRTCILTNILVQDFIPFSKEGTLGSNVTYWWQWNRWGIHSYCYHNRFVHMNVHSLILTVSKNRSVCVCVLVCVMYVFYFYMEYV